MPGTGLEPAHPRILQPEYSASANSAIRANFRYVLFCGEGEIRTLGKIALTTVFENEAYSNHFPWAPLRNFF